MGLGFVTPEEQGEALQEQVEFGLELT